MVSTADSTLTKNVARANLAIGISAQPGTIDGGGNQARDNASIHAVFSVPPRFSYSRREIDLISLPVSTWSEQTGKLKLETALSRAANDDGDDHAAAVTRLLNHLHDLGFSGP